MTTLNDYTSPENGTVGAFKNQYDNILIEVTLDKNYSIEYFDDETEEERTSDFLFEYGESENSLKAIKLINDYINNNL